MKFIILFFCLAMTSVTALAQGATTLHENFDVDCVLSGEISTATGWAIYTKEITNIPLGQWTCSPTLGRPNEAGYPTPGIMCSDFFLGQNHLDSSFLVTPLLNLSSYTDSVYLQFDIKASNINLGANLNLLLSEDSTGAPFTSITVDSSIGFLLTPHLGVIDSGKWVTHQVNITGLIHFPFYIAFLYVTASNTGSTWYLDNVNISTTRLGVTEISGKRQQLTVIGMPAENHIELSYYNETGGEYQVALTDMLGRQVFSDIRNFSAGTQNFSIDGLGLKPGMYFIKITNGSESGVAKVVIR